MFPEFEPDTPFYPIICVSASKITEEGIERRREGYNYVQGAGDDHEFWSLVRDVTPPYVAGTDGNCPGSHS